jgi:hypothetical protein
MLGISPSRVAADILCSNDGRESARSSKLPRLISWPRYAQGEGIHLRLLSWRKQAGRHRLVVYYALVLDIPVASPPEKGDNTRRDLGGSTENIQSISEILCFHKLRFGHGVVPQI